MIKKYQTVRRVTITGPIGELDEAFAWKDKNGYNKTLYAGPLPKPGPRVDSKRFKLVVEKVIE